jgi:hypothetical protein
MPTDRAVQQSLGLMGFPQWYKNQQAVELRCVAPDLSPTAKKQTAATAFKRVGVMGGSGSWRRMDASGGRNDLLMFMAARDKEKKDAGKLIFLCLFGGLLNLF